MSYKRFRVRRDIPYSDKSVCLINLPVGRPRKDFFFITLQKISKKCKEFLCSNTFEKTCLKDFWSQPSIEMYQFTSKFPKQIWNFQDTVSKTLSNTVSKRNIKI